MNDIDQTTLIRFLLESNKIEEVDDEDSLQQAIYAWDYLITQDTLTTSVIRKTHKILMLHLPLRPDERGYFRNCEVMIGGHLGKPAYAVPTLMEQWALNVNDLIKNGQFENQAYLARVIREQHIRYEDIHPFVDGNGRTGRLFLNWTRQKLNLPLIVIEEAKKEQYYEWFRR